MRIDSIRTRLILWLTLPLIFIAGLVAIETFYSAQRTSNQLHDRTLLSVLLTVSEHMNANDGELIAEKLLEVLTENLGDQFFYHLMGPDDAFVTGYSGLPAAPAGLKLESGKPQYYDGLYQGDPVRVVVLRQLMSMQGLQGWGRFTVWQRVGVRAAFTFKLFTQSLIRLLLMVITAGSIVWIAVSYSLRPLESLRLAVEKRSPDDLTPIKRFVPFEVREIVKSMNRLFLRLSASGQERERFIGDAAHQLRNPIAALKIQAQAALGAKSLADYKSRVEGIVATTNTTAHLVEQLLTIARSHGSPSELVGIDNLAQIVTDVTTACAPRALARQQEISLEIDDAEFPVRAHATLLREALANLIDNAIQHNPANTAIVVGLKRDDAGARVLISVTDNGGSISEAELKQLVKPFAIGESASAGSGLGLSIVADIAGMHQGQLGVTATTSGKTLTLSLPLATITAAGVSLATINNLQPSNT